MPRSKSLTLGIDLNDHEIRVVLAESDGSFAPPSVRTASAAALPDGTIVAGVIHDPALVSRTLRRLIEPLRIGPATPAYVGILSAITSSRLLSLPPCEDREIPALVEGELEHQGVVLNDDPQETIVFPPRSNGLVEGMRAVAVISVPADVVRTVHDIVEGAGLKVAAVETSQIAKLRAASLAMPLSAATFFLILGPHVTGVSYFHGPDLVTTRRIDVGSSSLIRAGDPGYAVDGAAPLRFDHGAIDRLAIESLQMMEFVQRDYAQEIESVRVYAIEPELEMLAPMLERRFGLPTTFSPPPSEIDDIRYSVAYGLAVRDFDGPFNVPKIDLAAKMRRQGDAQETKRNVVGSLLASGLALAVGLVGCLCYGRLIGSLDGHARQVSARLDVVNGQNEAVRTSREQREVVYTTLRHGGVPVGAVMDDAANGADAGVRLKSVEIGKDFTVRVQGEARDEAALGRITQRLQASPVLRNVALAQLDRSSVPNSAPFTFEIDAKTLAADGTVAEAKP